MRVERSASGQLLLRGVGDVQLAVAIDRLGRRFCVGVDTEPLRVAYRETITGTAEAEGRHKKQTGGHGQFAVCVLRVEPLERGAGFQFSDKIVGGAISKGYIPAVQKGIEEAMAEGGPRGFPVVDVHVTLLDGKEHSVDSSELAFKLAARTAFRDAIASAGAGRARAGVDHRGRRARPSSSATSSATSTPGVVAWPARRRPRPAARSSRALVPEAELVRYSAELRSLTGGRGRFTMEHDHDEVVPANLVDRLVGAAMAGAGR